MFTTDTNDEFGFVYPVYWLRYDIPKLRPEKSYQKLLRIYLGLENMAMKLPRIFINLKNTASHRLGIG
jgi:hypothetical protein